MSFFDDDDGEPPTHPARPRRPAGARTTADGSRGGPSDAQQLMMRRAVALGGGALLLILVVLGVNGCLQSRAETALKDYNREVSAIAAHSNTEVSKRLFDLLGDGGGSTIGLAQNVHQVRVTATEDFRRAQAISTPSDMKDAQYHLLLALSLRREGVQKIAADVPDLTGNRKRAAVARITATMRDFLASDVIFTQRVHPYIEQVLADHDIQGQTLVASQFLPDDTWLDADAVGDRLGVAGASSATNATARPGTHGHGLLGVTVGSQTLQPSPAANRVQTTPTTAFTVNFQNQGENDEFDVRVRITISGSGKAITRDKPVDETNAGKPATTDVRFEVTPPLGVPVRVKVTVLKVNGELKTDNNTRTYIVTFER